MNLHMLETFFLVLQFLHRHAEANTSVAENSGFVRYCALGSVSFHAVAIILIQTVVRMMYCLYVRQVATQLETAGFFVSHPKNALEVDIAARKDRLSHFALRLA